MRRFQEKVAIVTGAGQGIGEHYAKALAAEGAAVCIAEINVGNEKLAALTSAFTPESMTQLKKMKFDRVALGSRGLPYERLDQLTMEILMGTR